MRRIFANLFILLCFCGILFAQDKYENTFNPSILLKPTLKVKAARDLNYWKQPNLKNFWSWMPKLQFAVSGPIPDASYFTYEFFTPEGTLWFSQDSAPFSIEEGRYLAFESEAVPRWTDKRSSIQTGVFSFKITLKNSLQGTSKLFYQGKFKVGKEFVGTPHPDFKNEYAYYVEQDWMLPIAYLNFNSKSDEDAPVFYANMWFRGQNSGKVKGFLFYNGKMIANTEPDDVGLQESIFSEGDNDHKYQWELWKVPFIKVRYFENNPNGVNRFVLKNNPGNYELKVMLDDEVARVIPFTVGKDGKIVDPGVAKTNNISGFGIIVPAKINPIKEGTVDLMSYKTDAFYGNPLTGF